jgi:Fe-S cluster biogenesis protein NfuA
MLIKLEKIENKNIINFYLPKEIIPENKILLSDTNECYEENFVSSIQNIAGVLRTLITPNFISVVFDDKKNLDTGKSLILAEIDDFVSSNQLLNIIENKNTPLEVADALADALIRPILNKDNGDIIFKSYSNGIISLQFTGKCSGCPYAQNTLNNIIIKNLIKYIPEIKQVLLVGNT